MASDTHPARPRTARRRFTLGCALVIGLLVVCPAIGMRAEQVHRDYWAWRLWPGRCTPRLPFDGHDYNRGESLPQLPVGAGTRIGSAPGHGAIYGSDPATTGLTAMLLYVQYPDGTVCTYQKSGGP